MNGWLLHTGDLPPELRRGIDEIAKRNIPLELVHPKDVDLVLDTQSPDVFVRGERTPLPDFVVAAFIDEVDTYNLALLQNLEVLGSLCINTAQTILNTNDKLRTHQLLARAGIPCPKTVRIHPKMTDDRLIQYLGLPLVLKAVHGSKGQGVFLVKTHEELDQMLQFAHAGQMKEEWIAQAYIAESHGRDIRVLVIDRRPMAAMLRASSTQFKSNFSQGGRVEAWPLTDEIQTLTQQVIDVLGLNIGGIDLLFSTDGFLVCEANSMPGFQGIESCCAINVPQEIFRGIARQLAAKKKTPIQVRSFLQEAESKGVLEHLATLSDLDGFSYFRSLCDSPRAMQLAVLRDILRRNAACEFGRAHQFQSIQDLASFRRQVPLTDWSTIEAQAKRMEHGEADVLFAGPASHFIISSGTTGAAKYIPESASGATAKSITGKLRIAAILNQAPSVMKGKVLPLSNSPSFGTTEAGIPIGSASGLALSSTPDALRKMMAFPMEIFSIQDPATLDYTLLRFALAEDVHSIIVNNAGRAEQLFETARSLAPTIIHDIAQGTLDPSLSLPAALRASLTEGLQPNPERAEILCQLYDENRFLPRAYWPNLEIFSCWLAGSIGRFASAMQAYLPATCRFFDCGYGASEGKFNIPMQTENPAGPLALHAAFYEFLPLDGGEPLLVDELQDQTAYQLVITTYSGLYRYDIHDVVRVKGFTGKTPNIHFEHKAGDVANIAGEKLSVPTIINTFKHLPDSILTQIQYYAVAPNEEERRYDFFIEAKADADLHSTPLAESLETALKEENITYAIFRNQHILHPCHVTVMRPGWQASLYETHRKPGQTTAQIKLPILMRTQPDQAFCLSSSS